MTPPWMTLLGPHPNGTRAVVKTDHRIEVNDVLLDIEAGTVALAPYRGLTPDETRACVGYAREHMPLRWRGDSAATGSRLVVGRSELDKAFRHHVTAWKFLRKRHEAETGTGAGTEASGLLLAVYAVECGFKSILMKIRNINTTEELSEEDFTHDLNLLSNKIMRQKLFGGTIELVSKKTETIPPARLHEALRYGRRLKPESYKRTIHHLDLAISHIEENIHQ